MPIGECMAKHTERQLGLWLRWFTEEQNRPSRADWYAMQIAAAFTGGKLEQYKLKFRQPQTFEERVRDTRAAWGLLVGGL